MIQYYSFYFSSGSLWIPTQSGTIGAFRLFSDGDRNFSSNLHSNHNEANRYYGGKSWVPKQDEILQKVTTQALIHEVSLQQMENSGKVVPWFLKEMPATYFRQVPETMRRQHLNAVSAMRLLDQSDLSLKIVSRVNPNDPEAQVYKNILVLMTYLHSESLSILGSDNDKFDSQTWIASFATQFHSHSAKHPFVKVLNSTHSTQPLILPANITAQY